MSQNNARERRRSARISPKGSVNLLAGTQGLRGRIANISRDGLLVTTPTTLDESLLGRTIDVEVRLDDSASEWLVLRGRVVRIEEGRAALELDEVPAAFLAQIDASSTASHRHRRVISVLFVDGNIARRAPMAEAFRAAGCSVSLVATPLEAIVHLGASSFEPDLILIADSLPATTAGELRSFVEREHPAVKLVTVGDEVDEPAGLLHWLSSTDANDDMIARVREMLLRPIRR